MNTHGETAEVGRLLYELCARLGFGLPAVEQTRLADSPPPDIDAFTDAVLLAEGLDPQLTDRELRNHVRDCVARYLEGLNQAGAVKP